MEATTLGYVGTMENNIETPTLGNIGIMENKMDTF